MTGVLGLGPSDAALPTAPLKDDPEVQRQRAARRRWKAVAEILRRWDPIGIEPGGVGPIDEYDGYVPLLVEMVERGCTAEMLAQRLGEIGAAMMGLASDAARDARIASEIVSSVLEPHSRRVGRKPHKPGRSHDEGSYTCPSCGETIVVPLDASAGTDQRYVEDCPVCCNPNVLHVELSEDEEPPRIWAEAE